MSEAPRECSAILDRASVSSWIANRAPEDVSMTCEVGFSPVTGLAWSSGPGIAAAMTGRSGSPLRYATSTSVSRFRGKCMPTPSPAYGSPLRTAFESLSMAGIESAPACSSRRAARSSRKGL